MCSEFALFRRNRPNKAGELPPPSGERMCYFLRFLLSCHLCVKNGLVVRCPLGPPGPFSSLLLKTFPFSSDIHLGNVKLCMNNLIIGLIYWIVDTYRLDIYPCSLSSLFPSRVSLMSSIVWYPPLKIFTLECFLSEG